MRCSIEASPLELPVEKNILTEVVSLIGLYHDIGKATSFFQEYIREENEEQKALLKNKPESKHSLISAIATYFAVEEYLKEENFDNDYASFLPISAFIAVRRHHTNLQAVLEDIRVDEKDEDIVKTQINSLVTDYLSFLPYWDKVIEKLKNLNWPLRKLSLCKWLKISGRGILPYLIQHFIYSLLLDADKHEVTVGGEVDRKQIASDIIERYREKKGFNVPNGGINELRNRIYKEVLEQVENLNLDQDYILSLSAPTGAGKTLTALAFAIELRRRICEEKKYSPRIIYCLPFLSIIDQNAKVIEEVFNVSTGKPPSSNYFLIHHHLSDYTYREEDTEYEPDKSEILIEGWDSEIIITTFVQLFHTLFTNKNKAIRKFHKIAGSIVILDEIQSFPPRYWLLFKETAEAMGKYFNTHFILSTATQPAIFENTKENTKKNTKKNTKELLVKKKEYFKSLRRTQIVIRTTTSKSISAFAKEVVESLNCKPQSTLIVLNTIQSAEDVWNAIKEPLKKAGFETYYLSSYVIPIERLQRIMKIKSSTNKKVIVSTQLVEAGVDIDLERVIRDFGPMDSINQVAGRANRNFKLQLADVEVVKLKDEKDKEFSYIYDPVLINCTERILESHSTTPIPEDKFLDLNNQYYQEVQGSISEDDSAKYIDAIKFLDYEKISEFKLFQENGDKVDIFVEIDSNATDIWKEYQQLLEIKDLKERKGKFLEIRSKFYNYVISVLIQKAQKNLPPEVGGIRYIHKDQLTEFYDLETGFKNTSEILIW